MKSIFIIAILADLSRTMYCLDKSQQASCNSPQYLEFQKTGTISCSFPPNFGIFWYNTSNYLDSEPIVLYQRYMKSGVGYDSGHYDVYPNGSLLIRNVSLHHDLTFHVAFVYSETEQPGVIGVRVIVMEKPSIPFPVFEQCGNGSNICYFETDTYFLQCSVRSARPNVTLQLIARTVAGDKLIPHHMSVSSDGFGYTTLVTTRDVFLYSPSLTLIVCKASSPPGMLENDESLMLTHKKNFGISQEEQKSIFVQRNARVELNCTEDTTGFVVWRKFHGKKNKYFETLIFALLIGSPITITFADDIELGRNGSLIVHSATVNHEGVYVCDCGDGNHDNIAVYEVAVFVRPHPPHPTIDGCSHHKYCVLPAEHDGNLTCKVTGIRPKVQLKLKAVLESESDLMYFRNENLSIKERGDTYDVTVTSTYHVVDRSREKITIECKVLGPIKAVNLKANMDLVFAKENDHPTEQVHLSEEHYIRNRVVAVLVVILFISCAVAALIFKLRRKRVRTKKEEKALDEEMSMLPESNTDYQAIEIVQSLRNNNLESIRQFCFEGVIISGHDKLSLQRSFMQLLEKAAKCDISIELVDLHNCLQEVNLSEAAIMIKPYTAIKSTIPIKHLVVTLSNRVMTEAEAKDILRFASMCSSLRKLWYSGCVPPQSFKDESTLTKLKSKNITVEWQLFEDCPWYILNKETGMWEDEQNRQVPTEEDFTQLLSQKTRNMRLGTEELYKKDVEIAREMLRKRRGLLKQNA